jgi:hypothetical protein
MFDHLGQYRQGLCRVYVEIHLIDPLKPSGYYIYYLLQNMYYKSVLCPHNVCVYLIWLS